MPHFRRFSSVSFVVLCLVSSVGCSSGSSSSGSSGSSGGSSGSTGSLVPGANARCLALAQAECTHDGACGWTDPTQESLCEASGNCENTAAEAVSDEEVDAGRITLDATAYAGCLADIAAAPCSETGAIARNQSPHCTSIAAGTSPVGASCLVGGDCSTPSSTCLRSSTACGGTCADPLNTGTCGVGYPGVEIGYFCGDDAGVSAQQTLGGACAATSGCLPPLLCGGTRDDTTCASQGSAAATQPCLTNADCAANGVCEWVMADGGGGVCMTRSGVGESCTLPEPDGGTLTYRDGGGRPENGLCNSLEYCDPVVLTCQPQSLLSASCAADAGEPKCVVGSCLGTSSAGTCTYLPDGQPCTRASDCLSGSCTLVAGSLVCAHSCP